MKKYFFVPALLFLSSHLCHSQNVGIGTSNPQIGKLEVYGAIGITSAIFGGDGAGVSFQRNSPSIGYNQYYNNQSWVMAPGYSFVQWLDMNTGSLYFDNYDYNNTANTPALNQKRVLTIRQNGNVSLNAGEANSSFFVGHNGYAPVTFQGTTYNSVFNEFPASHTRINAGKAGSHVYINDQSGDVYIGDGNINYNTKVGINISTASPFSMLDIKQTGGAGLLLVAPASSFNNWEFRTVKNLTDPGSDLYMFSTNGTYMGNFSHGDDRYYPISGAPQGRFNIQPVQGVLTKILQLNPVSYQMRNQDSETTIGFLAQEIKKIFPELVTIVNEPDTVTGYPGISDLHTMDYEALNPLSIQAIREQQQIIADLQTRVITLRQKLEILKNKLNNGNKDRSK